MYYDAAAFDDWTDPHTIDSRVILLSMPTIASLIQRRFLYIRESVDSPSGSKVRFTKGSCVWVQIQSLVQISVRSISHGCMSLCRDGVIKF